MQQPAKSFITLLVAAFLLCACSKKINQQEDEIYSRHLQAHIKLTIISTPMPDDKSEMNLLLLNDGQEAEQLKVKETLTELYKKKLIQPLIIVAINAPDKNDIYGVAGYPDYQNMGNKADKYAEFIDNELYAFIKKRAGVRKFKSVAIAGCGAGGLSAFDIAWNHADKIDKVGVLSGAFRFSKRKFTTETEGYSDDADRIILSVIKSSRKRPRLKYWFYGDDVNETGTRYHDSIKINHTKDLIELIKRKNVCSPGDIIYTESGEGKHDYESWSKIFPDFLIWAFGK